MCSYWGPHITSPQWSYCILTRTFHTLIANTSTYWQIRSVALRHLQVWKFPWRFLHCSTCLVGESERIWYHKKHAYKMLRHACKQTSALRLRGLPAVKKVSNHREDRRQTGYLFEVTCRGDCSQITCLSCFPLKVTSVQQLTEELSWYWLLPL